MEIYFTPKLRKDYGKQWTDIQSITKQTGARIVSCVPDRISNEAQPSMYLGAENDDPSVAELQAAGTPVYRKDVLTQSILAGELVDEAEFALPLVEGGGSATRTSETSSGASAVKGKRGKGKRK